MAIRTSLTTGLAMDELTNQAQDFIDTTMPSRISYRFAGRANRFRVMIATGPLQNISLEVLGLRLLPGESDTSADKACAILPGPVHLNNLDLAQLLSSIWFANFREQGTMAVDSAGLFSLVYSSWVSKIMYKAYRKGITMEELPSMSPYDAGVYNSKRLELMWREELAKMGPEKASFSRVAWRFTRTRVFAGCLLYICSLISGFVSYTYLTRNLLEYVQSGTGTIEEGVKWALLLILTETSRTFFMSWAWTFNIRTGVRLRSACLTLLYAKIIGVDNLGNRNIGKVINTFSNDSHKIFEMMLIGPMVVGAPICTVFGIFYILWLLGPMALTGMLAFLLFFPIQYILSGVTEYFQAEAIRISDIRVRLMNEILDCIKLVKIYAWEERFSKDLLSTRQMERRYLLRRTYCQSFSESVATALPIISATVTFLAHVAVGNNLTAAQVFPYTAFVDSGLRLSLFFFQDGIFSIISARISFNRLQSLLLLREGNCRISKPIITSQAIAIANGTFACNTHGDSTEENAEADDEKRNDKTESSGEQSEREKLNKFTEDADHLDILFDISFKAEKGKLVGICGQVGSGKSSLLLAALGQLRVSDGQVMRDGSCAYVSQQAWITNATLRDNILFGAKFDHSQYQKTIHACNLVQDIEMMPAGDQTEIGEKGVNLSGGQKQRVALARALYADRDIYFLDDPLSAVDSRVGAYIFENLLLGALKEKTVLFVTHQIQYLNRCDDVYMMRDGRIIEHGTHDELMDLDNEYASMVSAISAENEKEKEPIEDQPNEALLQSVQDISAPEAGRICAGSVGSHVSIESVEKSKPPDGQLTVAENLQQGSIKAGTYHAYIMAAGGYFSILIVLLAFCISEVILAFNSSWLAIWIKAGAGANATTVGSNGTLSSDNIRDNPDFGYYQTIYASTIGFMVLASVARTLVYSRAMTRASTTMHNDLFNKIITSPMRFFDTTPSGRIQHLFSRDMDEVDNKLPVMSSSLLQATIILCIAMLIICVVFPWFLLPLCILAAFYYLVSKIFRVAIRDLKRMDNKARALVISFTTASVQGLSTIHAFGKENEFMTKFTELFDENSKCLYLYNGALRWLGVRIDAISVAVTFITAILVIVLRNEVPPSLAGLALTFSSQISDLFQYVIRMTSETEVRFISVERINQYVRTLKPEASGHQPTVEPPSTWPAAAEIKFSNVSMAYGEDAPIILKDISFTVNAGEKIGIVGRTGSGKSSLTVALFRLVELAKGKIEIDDVDISKISLQQLRSKLSIIPQDPVLFSGTIRSNLDPFKLYTDAEIWEALEKTELKSKIQSISGQLDASVEFGGDNMSVGERQLLCLARALLRNSKILVLDEATAGVDPETEVAVQKTVQKEFTNCTILTIAHRLQTVLPLDRILVMDNGKVLEFDTPSNLLEDPSSEFSKMLAAAEQAESQ